MHTNIIIAKDFCINIFDGTHDSPKYIPNGLPLITSKYIKNNSIDIINSPKINYKDFNNINKRSLVKQWDILISMIGTVGEVSLVKEIPNFAIKNIGVFRADTLIKAKLIYYYLQSSKAKYYIKNNTTGSTQQYITLTFLKKFKFEFPTDIELQHSIVDIMYSRFY